MKRPYTKSGKCGNVVWQRNRYGQIHYPFFIPANPRSPAQRLVRGTFGSVSARWRTLTEVQRISWRLAGKDQKTRGGVGGRWPLPGFNYFMRVNVFLANRGQAQLDLPPGDAPLLEADLRSLSQILSLLEGQLLGDSAPPAPGFASRAPSPSG